MLKETKRKRVINSQDRNKTQIEMLLLTLFGINSRTHSNVRREQGRPAKNMGPVPNYTLGPQSNKANFEYLYIMLEHIFKIKSDVLIPFFF